MHLIVMTFCIALGLAVIYVAGPATFWNSNTWWQSIAVWFIGAALLHDLVLFPLYAVVDRALRAGFHVVRKKTGKRNALVPVLNYVRIPAMATALTFVFFFPGIIRQGAEDYERATGLTQEPFAMRWFLFVIAIFALSFVIFAVRWTLARRAQSLAARATLSPSVAK